MTSTSSIGSTNIILQFDLNRNIDGAARDVQAAINAARSQLPANLPSNPTYRKVNPADAPVLILALTSETATRGQMYDAASTILQQKLSQVEGVGQVQVGGSSLPAVRVDLNPTALNKYGIGLEDVRTMLASANANSSQGPSHRRRAHLGGRRQRSAAEGRRLPPTHRHLSQRCTGAADRRGRRAGFGRGPAQRRPGQRQACRARDRVSAARRQHHRDGGPGARGAPATAGVDSERDQPVHRARPHDHDPRLAARRGDHAADLNRPW